MPILLYLFGPLLHLLADLIVFRHDKMSKNLCVHCNHTMSRASVVLSNHTRPSNEDFEATNFEKENISFKKSRFLFFCFSDLHGKYKTHLS